MDDVLAEALAPVLRDLDRSGLTPPTFESVDWDDEDPEYVTAMMWSADGSGSSVSVRRVAPLPERIAEAADRVQECVIESQLWGSAPSNWPPFPRHPDGHPVHAGTAGDRAVWVCPSDQSEVALIGG